MSIITSILGSDQPKDSRTVINTNFSNLNTDKVEKDANGNITANNFFANSATTVSAGGTTVMTVASARIQNLTGTTTQTFQLPDATTLVLSQLFLFNNNSSQSLTITNNGAVSQYVIPAGGAVEVYTTNISTANGTFDFHPLPPSTVTWGSGVTGLVMNSVLNTTPTVSAGASSSTAPVFIPQRGTLNTGIGGDATNIYGIVGGVTRMTVNSTGISTPGILTQNGQTVSEADFYKYQISRTVASNNLTVTLLNYQGATPSATVPVKWQDGSGTIRTISSALTVTFNAATNYLNLGSTELATKEADLFTYFQWNTTTTATNLLVTRFPSANTMADIINNNTGEKGAMGIVNYNSTDTVVNIGRFNAILSAGGGYTWSIPATSIIKNFFIYETEWKDCVPTIVYNGTSPSGTEIRWMKYKIVGTSCFISYHQEWTVAGVGNSVVTASLPISEKTTFLTDGLNGGLNIGTGSGYGASNGSTVQCRGGTTRTIGTSINSNTFIISGSYQI